MSPALIVRFRPSGPWRFGPENGARDQVDRVFHSDSLYSAVTAAMRDLGWLRHWLAITAESETPAVRLSSCFPYIRRTLMIEPPRSVWPPAQTGKLRWKSARFLPVSLIPTLLRGEDLNEEQWAVEPVSGCLLAVDRSSTPAPPFRVVKRTSAPVDRATGASGEPFETACLQFAGQAGMWFAAVFDDDVTRESWGARLRSAARLLADTGLGGERSRGWGRSAPPAFEDVTFPGFLTGDYQPGGGERAWWMLSLFTPAESDQVDWSRGNYGVVTRAGRVESLSKWGGLKPAARMVSEGSVLLSTEPPVGAVRDLAPADVPHPVYRSGVALAVPVAWHESRRLSWLAAERQHSEPVAEPEPEVTFEYVPEEPVVEEPQAELAPAEAPAEALTQDEARAEEPPVAEEPSVEEPPVDESRVDEPSVEEPAVEEPSVEEPSVDEPPVDESRVDEPSVEEPPVDEPPIEEPPLEEPAVDDPPIEEPPAGELPPVREPAADDSEEKQS